MSVTYLDIFSSTDNIREAGSGEVYRRTSASRAYYGAYHCALRYANEVGAGVPLSSYVGGTHQVLSDFYSDPNSKDEFAKRRKSIGYMLKQAHVIRCLADYELDEDFSEEALNGHVAQCLMIAEKVRKVAEEVGA